MGGRSRTAEIAVAAGAILAAGLFAALPSLDRGAGAEAAERRAIAAALRIANAQAEARAIGLLDRDQDGRPTVPNLVELCAAGLLGPEFAAVDSSGALDLDGYRFRLWLPALGGGFVPADLPCAAVDPGAARRRWRLFAWPVVWQAPVDRGPLARIRAEAAPEPRRRAFFVDETGRLRATANRDRRYEGDAEPGPAAACADGWPTLR
jgi:hypothetical protein